MSKRIIIRLSREEWQNRVKTHEGRLLPFLTEHRNRQTVGVSHPVYDFLFSYYSFSGGQLLRWTPGAFVEVESRAEDEVDWPDHFSRSRGIFSLKPKTFPERRLPFLNWAIQFFRATLERPPVFHCFGLHEWAMVYKAPVARYPEIPFRLSHSEIEAVVEESPLRCTHYDAFRFFTDAARPLNRSELGPKVVQDHDQGGCIHANMDLYRLGYKIAPFVESELMADLFFLAKDAREIDMRASPYDLSSYGFEPLCIETREGRESYVQEQRRISELARPLREKLLQVYTELRDALLEGDAVHSDCTGFPPSA